MEFGIKNRVLQSWIFHSSVKYWGGGYRISLTETFRPKVEAFVSREVKFRQMWGASIHRTPFSEKGCCAWVEDMHYVHIFPVHSQYFQAWKRKITGELLLVSGDNAELAISGLILDGNFLCTHMLQHRVWNPFHLEKKVFQEQCWKLSRGKINPLSVLRDL